MDAFRFALFKFVNDVIIPVACHRFISYLCEYGPSPSSVWYKAANAHGSSPAKSLGTNLTVVCLRYVLHKFLRFNINTTAFCLGQSSLHLLLLKRSMATLRYSSSSRQDLQQIIFQSKQYGLKEFLG